MSSWTAPRRRSVAGAPPRRARRPRRPGRAGRSAAGLVGARGCSRHGRVGRAAERRHGPRLARHTDRNGRDRCAGRGTWRWPDEVTVAIRPLPRWWPVSSRWLLPHGRRGASMTTSWKISEDQREDPAHDEDDRADPEHEPVGAGRAPTPPMAKPDQDHGRPPARTRPGRHGCRDARVSSAIASPPRRSDTPAFSHRGRAYHARHAANLADSCIRSDQRRHSRRQASVSSGWLCLVAEPPTMAAEKSCLALNLAAPAVEDLRGALLKCQPFSTRFFAQAKARFCVSSSGSPTRSTPSRTTSRA